MQAGFDPVKAKIRLNWGSPESPEIVASDLISAASASAGSLPLIRPEEFRKNAVKILGWELWDDSNSPPRRLLQVQVTVTLVATEVDSRNENWKRNN